MKNEETKLCKHCQTEIPKKAKVCPNCRKKQGKGCLGLVLLVLGIIIFIVFFVSMLGGSDNEKPKKVSDTNVTSDEDKNDTSKEAVFYVGETAELNGVQVTMSNFEESNGDDFVSPADGNVFVLAEFEIVNNTDDELAISSIMSFEAYADDYALNYSLSATMLKDGQLDGTVAAGKKMKGWIGWEVSDDYKNVEVHFTDSVWSNNEFVFLYEK